MCPLRIAAIVLVALAVATGCESGGDEPGDVAGISDAVAGVDSSADTTLPGTALEGFRVVVEDEPPRLRILDDSGRELAATAPGILRLRTVTVSRTWLQGSLGVAEETLSTSDFAGGTVERVAADDGLELHLVDEDGTASVALRLIADEESGGLLIEATPSTDGPFVADRVDFLLDCREGEAFYGLGGQTHAWDLRGRTVPIRVAEQGLGKDPALPESEASIIGHDYDAYFPVPYVLGARPGPDAAALGWVLLSEQRSRFLLCSEDPDLLEIQAAVTRGHPTVGATSELPGARLLLLPGPSPKNVVGQFTARFGRAQPLPAWAFGPWVAFKGEPEEVAAAPEELEAHDIAATAIWDQDFRNYDHPGLPAMAAAIHEHGLRVLTYMNTFLDAVEQEGLLQEAIDEGYLPLTPGGEPYTVTRVGHESSIVDLTNPAARDWMADRLEAAYATGVDGWMADYGEWVAPDMQFHDGRDGAEYANLYTVDWAQLNAEVLAQVHDEVADALYFSRSGYLGSNPFLKVVWAGDQTTDFGALDGLPSVIPYGVHLGLTGVSAFGHDIAGFTGVLAPPSTKELYFRWTSLGAFSPVMRTHRGFNYSVNWDWSSDAETIAHFQRYTVLHLRMLPYLEALHREAVETGIPAMRHPVLEFPEWDGVASLESSFLLGPALFVAPVVTEGSTSRTLTLPPGRWYDFWTAGATDGPLTRMEDVPVEAIPVYLRAGGIVPLLPEAVRRAELSPQDPALPAAADLFQDRLELLVGAGEPGQLTLSDGTALVLERGGDDQPLAGVVVGDSGDALPVCGEAEDPVETPCVAVAREGRGLSAARTGPGTLLFGGDVAGGETWVLRITGGPAERRYLATLFFRP